MSLCSTDMQGRASVARRNICQPFETHPRLQQPQYHHQTLGLRITLPSTQQPEARTEKAEPQRSYGTRRRGPSYDDDEYAFLGDDNEEGHGSDSDMDDEEDATSSISSGRDSMFYGGSSGSDEGDELQHQQLGESVPGIGSFYVRRDQVLRRRRRDFVKLKRSQKAKIVKTAYSVIEAVCETFFPGERMELLDAIIAAHKTYRRRHQNNHLVGSTPNGTPTTNSSSTNSSVTPMVWGKKQQNASPPCTPPAPPVILRAPGTRRTRASSLSMAPAEETRNPDPELSSFSSSTSMDRTMTRSAATAAGNTTSSSSSSSGWHRQAGGWGGVPSSSSSSSSSSFGRPSELVRGQGRALDMNMEWAGGMMKKSSSTSSFPSFASASAPSRSSSPSSSSMFSPSQEPIQPMQSYIMPPVHVVAAGATAAGRTAVPPSSSWATSRTAVSPTPFSSSLPSSSSPRLGGKGGTAEQEDGGVPEEAWILHGLRFAAGGIIEC